MEKILSCTRNRQYCVIVGGPGGIGKSVFWEALFKKRAVQTGGDLGVWSPLPGPTRAVNLLTCANLDVFKAQIIDTIIPKPIFPSFGLSSPRSYEMALDVLSNALQLMASQSRSSVPHKVLILYIEDVNRLATFDGWQDCFVPLASAVASSGNGIVVGNSSALLAYLKFESLSHTGLRTTRFFYPSVPSDSEELVEFLKCGGHLYRPGCAAIDKQPSLFGKSELWNGNMAMLMHGTSDDEDDLRICIGLCLTVVNVFDDSNWRCLVNNEAPPRVILNLRMQLLQMLADAPRHEILLSDVPPLMRQWKIVEQLAAMNLVTFRTLENKGGFRYDDEKIIVVPYYPAVVKQYKVYCTSRQSSTWWNWTLGLLGLHADSLQAAKAAN